MHIQKNQNLSQITLMKYTHKKGQTPILIVRIIVRGSSKLNLCAHYYYNLKPSINIIISSVQYNQSNKSQSSSQHTGRHHSIKTTA